MKLISLNLPKTRVKAANDGGWIPDNGSLMGLLPRTGYDFEVAVGDGLGSNVLMSAVGWIQRTFPEAPCTLVRERDEDAKPLDDHAMVELLDEPNPYYCGDDLWKATIYSWLFGDAYWRKIRNGLRGVNELWYVPHWLMEPKWVGREFISYYEYRPGGTGLVQRVPTQEVVHFRNGINPRNTRKGMSQIYPVLREIFGDDEAANFSASLLRNMGVPGIVYSPDGEQTIQDADAVKAYLKQQFTKDKRGEPLVSSIPVKIQSFGFDPKSMTVGDLRDIAEERICSALGVRPSVIGYGSGLQTTKVGATMKEDVALSWSGCIIPLQKVLARTLEQQLLPDFEPNPKQYCVKFDTSEVEALRENRKLTAETSEILFRSGIATRAEARKMNGLSWEKTDEVYVLPLTLIEVQQGMSMMDSEPAEETSEEPQNLPKRIKTDLESRVIAAAPDGTPSRQQRALIARFVREALTIESDAQDEFSKFFAKMGAHLADAAISVMENRKAKIEDELLAQQILSASDIQALSEDLSRMNGELYLKVARKTYDAIRATIGLAVNLPDFRAQDIVKRGGRRAGLIDLEESTRKRLFHELSLGRSLGEGPSELAKRIREFVPAGTWSSPKVRSRVIARTETLHAQRASALDAYKDAPNVSQVMVFDGRLASSDEDCQALQGKIVELSEAEALMHDEHPNGTRSFAPVVN